MLSHIDFLCVALDEARKCVPTLTAFCVGCVITASHGSSEPAILATGYSRELPGNTHAEANALAKLSLLSPAEIRDIMLVDIPSIDRLSMDVYTTLEPCSIRSSGLSPCSEALISARIKRCFIGAAEPDDFVNCEGAQQLIAAGIQVIWLKGKEDECLAIARTGHPEHELT